MKQEFSQSQIELKAHIDHTDKQPTPTQRVERLRKLKYIGGGYFRDDTIPQGTTAEIVHAPEVLEDALQLATELEAAQKVETEFRRINAGLCQQLAEVEAAQKSVYAEMKSADREEFSRRMAAGFDY